MLKTSTGFPTAQAAAAMNVVGVQYMCIPDAQDPRTRGFTFLDNNRGSLKPRFRACPRFEAGMGTTGAGQGNI